VVEVLEVVVMKVVTIVAIMIAVLVAINVLIILLVVRLVPMALDVVGWLAMTSAVGGLSELEFRFLLSKTVCLRINDVVVRSVSSVFVAVKP